MKCRCCTYARMEAVFLLTEQIPERLDEWTFMNTYTFFTFLRIYSWCLSLKTFTGIRTVPRYPSCHQLSNSHSLHSTWVICGGKRQRGRISTTTGHVVQRPKANERFENLPTDWHTVRWPFSNWRKPSVYPFRWPARTQWLCPYSFVCRTVTDFSKDLAELNVFGYPHTFGRAIQLAQSMGYDIQHCQQLGLLQLKFFPSIVFWDEQRNLKAKWNKKDYTELYRQTDL